MQWLNIEINFLKQDLNLNYYNSECPKSERSNFGAFYSGLVVKLLGFGTFGWSTRPTKRSNLFGFRMFSIIERPEHLITEPFFVRFPKPNARISDIHCIMKIPHQERSLSTLYSKCLKFELLWVLISDNTMCLKT